MDSEAKAKRFAATSAGLGFRFGAEFGLLTRALQFLEFTRISYSVERGFRIFIICRFHDVMLT